MDGHKREDIKDYWQNVFLPLIALYARKMMQWEPSGPEAELML